MSIVKDESRRYMLVGPSILMVGESQSDSLESSLRYMDKVVSFYREARADSSIVMFECIGS
jgi:hypothetical protein